MTDLEERNYRAFQYLLKKRPKEYRGLWMTRNLDSEGNPGIFHIYVGLHIYEPLIAGAQLARVTELFKVIGPKVPA